MIDQKSRIYLKRVKQFQKIRAACEWGFIVAFVVLTFGFIASIAVFAQNTRPDLAMILLMSGLIIICISSMIAELSRFSEVWARNKLRSHPETCFEIENESFLSLARKTNQP